MVEQIQTDSEKVVNLGWLTNLAVTRVGLRVERIPTDFEKVVNSGWLTNSAVMRVAWMARRYR